MGTTKRERQKQGRQARIEAARAEAAKRKRIRTALLVGAVVVVLVAATLAMGGLGGDDDTTETVDTTFPIDTSTTSSPFPAITVPEAGAAITGETPCPAADGSSERTTSFEQAPPTCIDADVTYKATITTAQGDIVLELDPASAPVAVNNFVVLARYHFYDGVAFHRIIPGFMIQSGDAVGPTPGTGDPGYEFDDELTGSEVYAPGAVAMANNGPDTNGSQFFIMASTSSGLSPDYVEFGRVVEGQEVVDAINLLGDAATDGTPTEVVLIESVTITEA